MEGNKYILFYSEQCHFSKEFLQTLYKYKDLYQKFIKVNVDDKRIKLPPYIREVPTIIVPNSNGKNDLHVGGKAFSWLNGLNQNEKRNDAGTIEDYDPSAMSGFSDGYSLLGDAENNMFPKNFSSPSGNDFGSKNLPPIPSDSDIPSNNIKGEESVRKLEELKRMRDMDVKPPVQRLGGLPGPSR